MTISVETKVGRKNLIIETGKLAKQADGAALVRYGDTVVLTTVVSRELEEEPDFFPLFVEYREMTYAAGKIPGGFFKREGRPSEKETVTSRMIDRPLRPLFSEDYLEEVQIISTALSVDNETDPDILGIIGGSVALAISDIPFPSPVGAVRIGRIGGELVINPSYKEIEEGGLDLVVCGWEDGISMVEGSAVELSEEIILSALKLGQKVCGEISSLIKKLTEKVGGEKKKFKRVEVPPDLEKRIEETILKGIDEAYLIKKKKERNEYLEKLRIESIEKFGKDYSKGLIKRVFEKLEQRNLREKIINENFRPDGRRPNEIRPVSCEVGILPRTHGSALFTRGETQSLVTATLGTAEDEQILDELKGESSKTFMLHYNFPPFSVGEVKPIRGPSRRDIGHGNLAERALKPIMPQWDKFPYTLRLVSDILESNGSSSMATVCGASLCCFDAGVPVKEAVAGVALGLVKEGNKYVLLTDIIGLEDNYGDMDLKIAGTRNGITAIQLDIKIKGIEYEILKESFFQLKEARGKILAAMNGAIPSPRQSISTYAPHISVLGISTDKIGDLIGPGGKNIRRITSETGAKIDIDELKNSVTVAAPDKESMDKAIQLVKGYIQEVQPGETFEGVVTRTTTFGAFVEILPGQEGLIHISELDLRYVKRVEDVVKPGDRVSVKVIKIDEMGRINLSRKALQEGKEEERKEVPDDRK